MRVGGKLAIACRRNNKGVMCYIPERGKIAGTAFRAYYTLTGIIATGEIAIFSPRSEIVITPQYGTTEIMTCEPFSILSINSAANAIAKKEQSKTRNGKIGLTEAQYKEYQ